ncbi:protein CHLOROPLAST IMPORT APPARATUS 2 isoform X2 [Malania oleifera]|uniref:protein CHLOROPLAST IMPORT APPARATUS 2 isoform X2 n=1 Tax=Malania oleifera TaxID=397392 RepID=UPI0025AE0F28|nr:protein CHLOROPLAST IMPORT APPARATUS 2 isoform X2 [Malania oleifera]
MSSCLSGGGRTYGFELEIVKSPSTSIRTSHSSSPSSTLSESSNSPIAISTRKPRTPRKRLNQTYNEAAALLSTANPNIFSTKHLTKPCQFTKPQDPFFEEESSELLSPFRMVDSPGCLLHQSILEKKPNFQIEQKVVDSCEEKPCRSPVESNFQGKCSIPCDGYEEEDLDAESILDEEIEEGIDSIMGNLSVNNNSMQEYNGQLDSWYGEAMGLNLGGRFEFGMGLESGVRALRHVDEGDWFRFPAVDIRQISPKFNKVSPEKRKKKKKAVEKRECVKENSIPKLKSTEPAGEISTQKSNSSLLLKLNYEDVMNAWSDRGSPFSDEIPPGSDMAASDASAGAD